MCARWYWEYRLNDSIEADSESGTRSYLVRYSVLTDTTNSNDKVRYCPGGRISILANVKYTSL